MTSERPSALSRTVPAKSLITSFFERAFYAACPTWVIRVIDAVQAHVLAREHQASTKTADLAQPGVSKRRLYNWKARYGGMVVSRIRKREYRAEQILEAAALTFFCRCPCGCDVAQY